MKTGKRTLTKKLVLRGATSVSIIPAGEEIEVTQIDNRNNKALVENHWVSMCTLESVSTEN